MQPTIQSDIIYGHKHGMAQVLDVYQPQQPNGAGIIFIQSGGWYSVWREAAESLPRFTPLLEAGFTVFSVWHGSSPKYAVPEAYDDLRRAVRFVKLNCANYGISPSRLGIHGTSAGGHLSLLLASRSDDGDSASEDAVLRGDNHVAAVVAYYPPVDLRGWTTAPPEVIDQHEGLRPSITFETNLEIECSPLLHVTPAMPPTLLIHGDQDSLVDADHSHRMFAALQEQGIESELLVIPGAEHSFTPEALTIAVPAMVKWFTRWLC
ncbi:alpha/beta hydrolase [bacterium]|nr:MAG: alpha/beta hydrolase [bacterium]